ncbi:C6 transcription factor [Colletotrichum truncatum]|uniref:C6 transcription factor n=1 Tax=Colletotrichum truncatum TaxID=5467 RepID=A0ACC3ZBU2_COLTU
MESRGEHGKNRLRTRPTIARRSKIDDIANGIDGIRHLLERLELPATPKDSTVAVTQLSQHTTARNPIGNDIASDSASGSSWDHSAHVTNLLKSILDDINLTSQDKGTEASEIISSLANLTRTLEDPLPARSQYIPNGSAFTVAHDKRPPMPPLEATLDVLRWARPREHFFRIARISQVLPLDYFADKCQKVYFAVDNYSTIDFILANGYLAYVFAEHVITTGLDDYRENWLMCRKNLRNSVSMLPLILPSSMDTIAALVVAAFDAMENSNATIAWSFISSAASLCHALGYHRSRPARPGQDGSLQPLQIKLFWSVYNLDKGLSLQLDRPPNFRDADITLPFDTADETQGTRLARIQGKVYDQLYSPAGLSRPDDERGRDAEVLANQMREIIHEVHTGLENITNEPVEAGEDPLRILYHQCKLVCHSSLLALILRAVPAKGASLSGASDECVAVARLTLDVHQQCMTSIRNCKTDSSILKKYISWAILNIPFVSFSILFTHAIRSSDAADLALLDRFANSLQPDYPSSESVTHPHRLYQLLCKVARLYGESGAKVSTKAANQSLPEISTEVDLAAHLPSLEAGTERFQALVADESQITGLSDWFYGNQQLMNLLGEDMMY